MHIFHSKQAAHDWARSLSHPGRRVGLVPTMGALHEGHFSLVRQSLARCDATVATIFVNPTQFGPDEDLGRYPRTLEEDLAGLRRCGADAVFVPDVPTMYPHGSSTSVHPPRVAEPLEGLLRPGHFGGVATIVLKLMHILPTTHAFFGQKDFQQAAVIRAMVRELDVPTEVEVCPIIREADGLAMSSRNRYLSAEERTRGLAIWRALQAAQSAVLAGESRGEVIESRMRDVLTAGALDQIDYAVLADPDSLAPVEIVQRTCVALIAARVGTTRLIDNLLISPS